MKDETDRRCCSEGQVFGAEVRPASVSCARFIFCEYAVPFRMIKQIFLGSGFSAGPDRRV
jgi:hypothetical protein